MKLLLVSPQPGCFVGQLLSDWGHRVRHVLGVEQVGALLQDVEGVLVVGTGGTVAEDMARLRTAEVWPRPFLLALLPASAEQVPLEALLAAAVDDFLLMPFEPAQLQARLEWLSRRGKAAIRAPLEMMGQELFHSFMNHSPVLAFMKDEEGRRVWVNEPYARFFQRDMDSILGAVDSDLLPPMAAARLRREDQAVLSSGQPLQSEQIVPSPEGVPHHWLNHKFTLRDASGRRLLGGVSIDMTARKHAEKALRRSEESFRALIEGLPEAIFAHRGGNLLYINPAGLTFLDQRSVEELAGKSLLELIHPDDRSEAAAVLEGPLERGPATLREVRFLRAGGQVMTAELSAMRLLFDGEPATVVSARDLTERKQMQARLLLADRLASVGTLAAGVAHEINNPLAFVLSNLGFLEEECQFLRDVLSPERLREMEDVLRETKLGAERVRHIVRDLRTLSRDEGEQLTDVDVRGVLESSLGLVRHELRHRARLVKDFEPVPLVRASEGRLGQVLLNLLINAVHAVPDGKPGQHEVRVRLRAIAGCVVIEVRDTGCGIAPEILDRIFDPFFTTKPVGMGTGLGLSICHGIVTGLGGDITVESEVGQGSTFRITLPIPQVTIPEHPPRAG